MLLRFRFSNFGSFRAKQELSFVATEGTEHPEALISVPDLRERALSCAAIYGNNASGKTTVLRALAYVGSAVRNSHRLWEPDKPVPTRAFRGGGGVDSVSEFEVDFVLHSARYQYSFALDPMGIVSEQLSVFSSSKRQTWFKRARGKPLSFGRNLAGENKTIAGLTRSNSLFLSAAAQNNHEMLSPVYNWFASGMSFAMGQRSDIGKETLQVCAGEGRRDLTQLLAMADLGITDIEIQDREPDTESLEKTQKFIEALQSIFELKEAPSIEPHPSIQLVHRIGDVVVPFELHEESNGTLAFLSLLGPITKVLATGGIAVVDELDRSLHPRLAEQVIKLFNTKAKNPHGAQLVFNTHDTNLLSSGLLRRDQIWFVEKDRRGESQLYPLTDFHPRKEENLRAGYLSGRYGGVPFVGDLLAGSPEIIDAEL